MPYGYSTLSLNGSWYQYESAVEGNFSTLETSGNSGQAGLGIDRVISRDKDSITTVRSGLTYKQTNNFLLGNLIEVADPRRVQAIRTGVGIGNEAVDRDGHIGLPDKKGLASRGQ